MASLDINADILKRHGPEVMTEWYDALLYFYQNARNIPGLVLIGNPFAEGSDISLDITKINLDMSAAGLDAAELEAWLMERGIYAD